MLRPFKVVEASVFADIFHYEIGYLRISKNKETNKFQLFGFSDFTGEDKFLLELSVEELRYCCGFSLAILKAVYDYYDCADTTMEDIHFIGIPKYIDFDELSSEFKSYCDLAFNETNDADEIIDCYYDAIEMLKNELDIYRIIRRLKLVEMK